MFLQHGMMMLAWSVPHCNSKMRYSHTLNLDDKRWVGVHDETPQSVKLVFKCVVEFKELQNQFMQVGREKVNIFYVFTMLKILQ